MKKFRFFSILIVLLAVCFAFSSIVYASGTGTADINERFYEFSKVFAVAAAFICTFKLMQIGVKFMLTGASDKSQAKMSLIPWLIGTVTCGGYGLIASVVIPRLEAVSGNGDILHPANPEEVVRQLGQWSLGVMSVFAGTAAVGMLIFIGIRYMAKGAGEMAKVKNTLMPYIIGAILVSGAAQFTSIALDLMFQTSGV